MNLLCRMVHQLPVFFFIPVTCVYQSSAAVLTNLGIHFGQDVSMSQMEFSSVSTHSLGSIALQAFAGYSILPAWRVGVFWEYRFQREFSPAEINQRLLVTGYLVGPGLAFSHGKWFLQGAHEFMGSVSTHRKEKITQSSSPQYHDYLGPSLYQSPSGFYFKLGYQIFNLIFLHMSYNGVAYSESIETNKTIDISSSPLKNSSLGIGLTVVY